MVATPSGQLYAIGGNGASTQVALYGPRIGLAPDGGPPGSTTALSGNGFTPGASVTVTWGPAGGPVLAQATADLSGTISVPLVIPPGAVEGDRLMHTFDDAGWQSECYL